MGCTQPLIRFSDGRIISMQKYFYAGKPGDIHLINQYGPELGESAQGKLLRKIKDDNAVLLPCGHCAGCKLANASSWANRMEMELPYHENAWFLTLTYNEDNIPYRYTFDEGTGEVLTENYSLCDEDMQKFWKRLRRHIEYHELGNGKLMYFQAGEYGGKTHRPHYHAIVYDLPIKNEELKIYKKEKGYTYYNCEWLEKIWGMGFVVIAPAEWRNMAYTARYTTKKIYGKEGKEYYSELGIMPEKCNMSKKPAIGLAYYNEHSEEIYQKDSIQLKNGRTVKPPRYFDKLFDLEHSQSEPLSAAETEGIEDTIIKAESEELKAIKRERRRIANDALFAQLKQTGLTMQEYYELKEQKNQEKMRKLIREEV